MVYETVKEIVCRDTNETIRPGDTVSIHTEDGGGYGSCKITKITDSGFHFSQGRSNRSIQYERVREINKNASEALKDGNDEIGILLEKAIGRVAIKSNIRNYMPNSTNNAELNAMIHLLQAMGLEIDFEWDSNKGQIAAVCGHYNGRDIRKNVILME